MSNTIPGTWIRPCWERRLKFTRKGKRSYRTLCGAPGKLDEIRVIGEKHGEDIAEDAAGFFDATQIKQYQLTETTFTGRDV